MTVLGPLLILTVINDNPEVTTPHIRLFADDSLLYRRITSSQDTNIIKQDLTSLEKWETNLQMAFNPEKCTVIHIPHNKKPVITNYQLHGHALEREHSRKYHGITIIIEDLKWNAHVNNITTRANRSLGFIRRNLRACKPPVKTAAYNTIVLPTHTIPYHTIPIKLHHWKESSGERLVSLPIITETTYQAGAVTNMMTQLGWERLEDRRTKSRLTMMYKISHVLVDVNHKYHLIPYDIRTRGTTKFREIAASRDISVPFTHGRSDNGIKLPSDTTAVQSLEGFKAGLNRLPAGHIALTN